MPIWDVDTVGGSIIGDAIKLVPERQKFERVRERMNLTSTCSSSISKWPDCIGPNSVILGFIQASHEGAETQ